MFFTFKMNAAIAISSSAIFLTIAGQSTGANAATILSPVSGTASSEFSSAFSIEKSINQSGLSQPFTSGVTDFDSYIGLNISHITSSTSNLFWLTESGVLSATIDYNLGALYTIDRFAIWNGNFAGIGSLNVLASSDGISYSPVLSGRTLINNPNGVPILPEIVAFSPTVARFVRLEASGCPQPDATFNGCAIGEIAFSVNPASPGATTPEPASLLGLGILGLGLVSRRSLARSGREKSDRSSD